MSVVVPKGALEDRNLHPFVAGFFQVHYQWVVGFGYIGGPKQKIHPDFHVIPWL